jgi:alkylhydroperoxidase/carboxymuconolactone decarboxylase family protein YurZ
VTDTPDDLARRLAGVRAKRGYLLPHHGLLAVAAPKLLEAYDAAYTALALDDRTLSHHDREYVWFAILIATDEALATHHIPKFLKAGGTEAEVAQVMAVTAFGLGVRAYRFVAENWTGHLPGLDPRARYTEGAARIAGDGDPRLPLLARAAVHACRADWTALAWAIEDAYAAGVPEDDLAEALTLVMFPGSVPYFVEACAVWRRLVASGRVAAGPRYRTWAELSGQGGWDEASGGASGGAGSGGHGGSHHGPG